MQMRYRKNASVIYSLKYHLVWCSKYRLRLLEGDIAIRLEQLLYIKANELGIEIHALEVMPDHVNMVLEADAIHAPALIAAQFKGYTSRILREEFRQIKSRTPSLWSRSYYIGSIGHVSDATVRNYITNQRSR